MKKIIFLLTLAICIISCKPIRIYKKVHRIRVSTSSLDSFVCVIEYFQNRIHYPDTNLPLVKPGKQIVKNGRYAYFDHNLKWEDYIVTLPADTLSVFFLDAKVFADSSWQTIRDKYLVLKRYDLSAEQLISMNYIINYP